MYTFEGRVRYSEVTKEQTLDLYAILNYFQDCSNFQSADLGVGVQYLAKRQRAWLLCAWQIELVRAPHLFERIKVGTWPYDFKGMYGYRNFIMYNESQNHEVAAYANSIWFLVDAQSGKPLRISPEDAAPYVLEPAYPMEYAPRKISLPEFQPAAATDGQAQPGQSPCVLESSGKCTVPTRIAPGCPPVTVTKMFLDTNNHVNNARYVQLAQSCLPESFQIRRMRAEYRRAAVLGDVIYPVLLSGFRAEDSGTKLCYVALNDRDGNAYAAVEFTA